MLTLTIASGNPRKVAEIEAMLGPLPLTVVRQPSELEVEETGKTYLENALLKASAAAQLTGTWSLADDSGLEVDALHGAPGLYTARLAPTDDEKVSKLLHSMADQPYRSARFRSAMVLCSPDGASIESSRVFVGVNFSNLLPTQVEAWSHFSGFGKHAAVMGR